MTRHRPMPSLFRMLGSVLGRPRRAAAPPGPVDLPAGPGEDRRRTAGMLRAIRS